MLSAAAVASAGEFLGSSSPETAIFKIECLFSPVCCFDYGLIVRGPCVPIGGRRRGLLNCACPGKGTERASFGAYKMLRCSLHLFACLALFMRIYCFIVFHKAVWCVW